MTALSGQPTDRTPPVQAPEERPSGRTAGARRKETRQRRCAVTRVPGTPDTLLRFAIAPDGRILPDLQERLPGRGIWLVARREVLEKALAKKLFSRAADGPVTAPADLADQVSAGLRQRCLELLSMARRGGHAVCGQHKVRALLERGEAAILVQARDAADGGKRRLAALGNGLCDELLIDESFTAEELGRPFGRGSSVHVAVARSGIAVKLLGALRRLRSFEEPAAPSGGPRKRRNQNGPQSRPVAAGNE